MGEGYRSGHWLFCVYLRIKKKAIEERKNVETTQNIHFFLSQSSYFISPVVKRTHEPPNNVQCMGGDQSKCWNNLGSKLKQREQVHEHIH